MNRTHQRKSTLPKEATQSSKRFASADTNGTVATTQPPFKGVGANWSVPQLEREILKLTKDNRKLRSLKPFRPSSEFDSETALRLCKERLAQDFLKRGPHSRPSGETHHSVNQTDLEISSLAIKGFYHYASGSACQDCVAQADPKRDDIIVTVVSDGVSSCEHSHLGAALLAKYTQEETYRRFDMISSRKSHFLSVENLASIHVAVVHRINKLLSRMQLTAFDAQEYLAATVQTIVIIPDVEAFVFASGDGFWALNSFPDAIESLVGRKKSVTGDTPALPITNLILRSFDEHAFPGNGSGRSLMGKLAGSVTDFKSKRELAITRAYSFEGRAPYLVWHGHPAELEHASLSTDGVRFAKEAASESQSNRERSFPLFKLLEQFHDRPQVVQGLVTLFNLATLTPLMQYYEHAFGLNSTALIDGAIHATADLLQSLEITPMSELSSFEQALEQHLSFHKRFIIRENSIDLQSASALLRLILTPKEPGIAKHHSLSDLESLKGGVFSCIQEAARSTLKNMNLPTSGFHFMDDVALIYATSR